MVYKTYITSLLSSVRSLSHVQLLETPWTAAHQACLSITNSWSLLKLIFIELVMPSNHLILYHPLLLLLQPFPASGSFQMSQLFASGSQSIGVSASTLVLPINTQHWSPSEWTGWISLQSKGLPTVFSNTNIQPWRTPFPIWNQSVVPCRVLTVASWPAYRLLKRQVRWSAIPISFRIFHSLLWSTQLIDLL